MPTQRSDAEARRRAAGRGRDGRADGARRAHRCRSRRPAHHRHRRQRPAVPHRRAHRRRLLPSAQRVSTRRSSRGLAYAPYADLVWCETGKPDLDVRAPLRRGDPARSSPASCSPTTARRRSTGRRTSTTRRSRDSSASSARWATSSSSSRWPGFHALNYSMFDLARGYAREQHDARSSPLQEAEFAAEEPASPRPSTSAKSAPATSTGDAGHQGGHSSIDCAHGLDRGGAVLARRPFAACASCVRSARGISPCADLNR